MMMGNRRQCMNCGEWITNAVMRTYTDDEGVKRGAGYYCSYCYGDGKSSNNQRDGISPESSDRQYHDGMFNRGEW